ncbi:class F sortase [Kitasatospora sp. NPDC096147]|uniref:class F sortase n=1 Tax=Kitasatospora sp. NPDC096147 TaxID=3364093 RepID=UPI00382CCE89
MAALSGTLLLVALIGAVRDGGRSASTSPPAPRAAAVPEAATTGPATTQVAGAAPSGSAASAPGAGAGPSPSAGPDDPGPGGHAPLAPSTPIRLTIAGIGVAAPLLALGSDDRGRPELPPYSMPGTAGWLRDSPTPGAQGAAVVAGHVDTVDGPAVFWALSTVKAGASVEVTRVDGSTAVFTVDDIRTYPRKAFPDEAVYGPTRRAELRIITCGGRFDRTEHEYTSNVILFAHLTGAH